MANYHQQIIESCINVLGLNDIDLNNLHGGQIRKRSINIDDIKYLRSSIREALTRVHSRRQNYDSNSDLGELLDLVQSELLQVQHNIQRACDRLDRERCNADELLSQVLERNHRVFFDLVKIRDQNVDL